MSALSEGSERKMARAVSFAGIDIPSALDKNRANRRQTQTSWKGDEEFGKFASRKPRLSAGPYSRPTDASGTPLTITRGRKTEVDITSSMLGEGQRPASEIVVEFDTSENPRFRRRQARDNGRAPEGSRTQQPRSAADRKPKNSFASRKDAPRAVSSTKTEGLDAEVAESDKYIPRTLTATFEATNFGDLFGTPSAIPKVAAEPAIVDKAQAKAHRIQVQMEHDGGDYSRLLPDTIIADQSNPLNLAKATMGRRRDLGHRPRTRALNVVEGMVGGQAKETAV